MMHPMQNLIEVLPEPAFLVEPSGAIACHNSAAAEMGFFAADGSQSVFDQVLEPRERVWRILTEWSRSGRLSPSVLNWRLCDGSVVKLRCDGARVRGLAGTSERLILIRCARAEQATSRFSGLNAQIEELSWEVRRRRAAEDRLERLAAELRQVNESLENRVAERTALAERQAEQLRMLAVSLTQAEDRERRRVAKVLHDNLQQLLVAAKMRLDLTARREVDPAVEDAHQLINDAIDVSRSLTTDLSPPILHDAGLPAGLRWLARWMKEKHGLQIDLEADPQASPDSDVRVLVFESARELLLNVVKHARATRARVELVMHDERHVRLTIEDNGSGFASAEPWNDCGVSGGFGLLHMRERLALVGGGLEIQNMKRGGARVVVTAPVDPGKQAGFEQELMTPVTPVSPATPAAPPPPADLRDETIRVLLVDDHRVVRDGLYALLSSLEDVVVIGQASDGREAVEMARSLRPDLVLMDFAMPRLNGVEATRQIRAEMPDTQVIGLSMYQEPDRAAAMKAAGARAYLSKSDPSDVLIRTIRNSRAMRGQPV